jgi:Type IV secretion system pilin
MNKFKKLLSVIAILIVTLLSIPSFAQNENTVNNICDSNYFGSNTFGCSNRPNSGGTLTSQVKGIVNRINNFLVSLSPVVAVLYIVIGAYLIMSKGLKEGLPTIKWAIIGLVIIILSSTILSLVVNIIF